jgi:hypothetical protein
MHRPVQVAAAECASVGCECEEEATEEEEGLSGGSAGDHAVHKSDVEAGGDDTERRERELLENRLAHVRSQMSKEP